ncbi:MAG: ABC transporter permease, partial [Gemmatimonadaceae bacterium]
LALGIGANTAIFSLINAVILRDLPVRDPKQLVVVGMGEEGPAPFTNPLWEQLRDHQDVFENVLAFGGTSFNLASAGEERPINGYWVSGSFFPTLGVHAVMGRTISPSDDTPGCPAVIAISDAYWQGVMGKDPSVVGRTLAFSGHRVEIVGVVDPRFTGMEKGRAPQFYLPLCAEAVFSESGGFLKHRSWWLLTVVGRLREGMSVAQVNARLKQTTGAYFAATLPPRWSVENTQEYLKRTLNASASLEGLSELRSQYANALFVLMGIVAVVLLIACANVANLMLARSAVRQRELAVRVALGAARGRIVRQLFTEGLLLSIVGAVGGIVLAWWGSRGLVAFLTSSREAVSLDLRVDTSILAFTAAIAIATAILFGLAPALRGAGVAPQGALTGQGRGVVEGHSRFGIGKILVAAQVALSLVLVTGAALLLGSFRTMATMNPGFDADGIVVAEVDLHLPSEPRSQPNVERRRLLERLRALPESKGASASYNTPLSNRVWNDLVQVQGVTFKRPEDAETYINLVTDGYFSTMGMRLVGGRDISVQDVAGSPMVAVINETAARKFFKGRNPLGAAFTLQRGDGSSPPYEVVGVVSDAKYGSLRDATPATSFFAMTQDTSFNDGVSFVVRGRVPFGEMRAALGRVFTEMAPRASLRLRPLSVQLADAMQRERLLAALSVFFGGLALLLSVIGLYGTMAYSVARRRKEIGIRLALGAARSRVMSDVLVEVAQVLTIGVALGLAGALASTRVVAGFLFGVTARDPATFVLSALVLAVVAVLAGLLPALRASRMDPMQTLRTD